ncbi:MAG: hypothetical protein QHC67_03530 [Sphingobium sp.]|uniref:hypothetical protein n=1 Tax=Sphingobium sp. TaxID=1912891 RepID=UPI0029B9C773|nr:hypothetical protein [Sphingobium sp.]MDX3908870.1 hypothetical protein [Sphingobium sp.]
MNSHPITLEMLEEGHLLLLGTTRAGKTYQQRGFLERLRRADRRVGAVDKLGNHWGLTLSADGQNPGLDFIIFGGKRAHIPMSPADGDKLGRLFVTRNIPAIFDVSQWKSHEQLEWVEAFADAVFLHNVGALHLGLDEAQSWVPQGGGGGAFRSVLRLAEQGLGNGIRLMMAAQRLSRIDKSAAGMASVVIAMRQTGTADRKAMRDQLAANAGDIARIEGELAGLPTGTGFVWDPLKATLERHAFPENATFDSSRTPRHGDAPPAPIAVSSALVDELRQALAPVSADLPDDTIPDDPKAAREKGSLVGTMIVERDRRIAALEAQLAEATAELEHLRGIDSECDRYSAGLAAIEEMVDAIRNGRPLSVDSGTGNASETAPLRLPLAEAEAQGAAPPATGAAPEREYRSLGVLASIYPAGLTEAAWAARAGRSRRGGAWIRQRKRYCDANLIEQSDRCWFATEAGVVAAGADVPELPRPGRALVEWWANRIGAAGRLLPLIFAHQGMSRAQLAHAASMSAKGGAFIRYVTELKRAELIEERAHQLFVSSALLGGPAQ